MEENPLLSVVIPVFNGEKYLAEAIESVRAQTYSPIEIIVVDDGSSDRSGDIARGFGGAVRCEFIPHVGAGGARNRGLDVAQGCFYSFVDADDLWVKEKAARQLDYLAHHSEIDMVFGQVRQFSSPELTDEEKARLQGDGTILPGYSVGAMTIRRESFARAGRFESQWRMGEFIEWYLRAMDRGLKSHTLDGIVLHRRLHTSNMGITEKSSRSDYVRIAKAALDRRRKQL